MKRPILFSHIPLRPELYPVEPEVRLWRAVLDQAVQDLTDPNSDHCKPKDRKAAQVWLRGNSKDFWDVCFMAGLEPLIVIALIHKIVGGRDTLFKEGLL